METRFYRWDQEGGADEDEPAVGRFLDLQLSGYSDWDLRAGRYIEEWDPDTLAVYDDEADPLDFPFTSSCLPVYSPRLKALMESCGGQGIQYVPVRIRHRGSGREIPGYHLANYLRLIDCLDRERSVYQVWTKANLMFWEHRPYMLGTFRDVQRAVLDCSRIGETPIFRLWGWEMNEGVFLNDVPNRFIAGYGVRPSEVAPFLERHGLTTVALLADTGFAAAQAQELAELAESDPKAYETAIEIIVSTADDPSLLGASIHLLYIGQESTGHSCHE